MRTLFLADRDHAYRRALAHALRRRGLKVVEFASGSALYAEALGASPDLVLLEADLEEMDGFQVFARLRRKRREHPPRVLFLTSFDNPRVARACLAQGALGYLVKGAGGPHGEVEQVLEHLPAAGPPEAPAVAAREAPAARPPEERSETPRTATAVLSTEERAESRSAREEAPPRSPRTRRRLATAGAALLAALAALGVLARERGAVEQPPDGMRGATSPAARAGSSSVGDGEAAVMARDLPPPGPGLLQDGPTLLAAPQPETGADPPAGPASPLAEAGAEPPRPEAAPEPEVAAAADRPSASTPPGERGGEGTNERSSPAARVGSRLGDSAGSGPAGAPAPTRGAPLRDAGPGEPDPLPPTYEFLSGLGLAAPPGAFLDGPNSHAPQAVRDGPAEAGPRILVFTFRTRSAPGDVEGFYEREGVRFNRRVVPMGGRFQGVARAVSRGTHRTSGGVETTITVSRPGVDAVGKELVPETTVRLDVRRP